MQRDAALVLEATEITPGVFVTWYDAPSLAAGATPGQFAMVDPGWETWIVRPATARAPSPTTAFARPTGLRASASSRCSTRSSGASPRRWRGSSPATSSG